MVTIPHTLCSSLPIQPCPDVPKATTYPLQISSVLISPQPLLIGKQYSIQITGTVPLDHAPDGLSTHDIPVALSLTSGTASLSGEHLYSHLQTDLCSLLGYNFTESECPVLRSSSKSKNGVPGQTATEFQVTSAPGRLVLPDGTHVSPGVFDAQLMMSYQPAGGKEALLVSSLSTFSPTFYTCVAFQQVVSSSWLDYVPAIVSFTIASAASWHLGKAFPSIKLPIITGYLMIGVVVGPYVTNLVTRYHVWLLGQLINDIALSFISFAAGAEIFFPELRGMLSNIIGKMKAITLFTMMFVCVGFYILVVTSSSSFATLNIGGWVAEEETPCRISIVMLVGIIMVGRSPSSVVAVAQEMASDGSTSDNHHRAVKLSVGITVMSDVVVLIGFALLSVRVFFCF